MIQRILAYIPAWPSPFRVLGPVFYIQCSWPTGTLHDSLPRLSCRAGAKIYPLEYLYDQDTFSLFHFHISIAFRLRLFKKPAPKLPPFFPFLPQPFTCDPIMNQVRQHEVLYLLRSPSQASPFCMQSVTVPARVHLSGIELLL